jgi:hypothetical protein
MSTALSTARSMVELLCLVSTVCLEHHDPAQHSLNIYDQAKKHIHGG